MHGPARSPVAAANATSPAALRPDRPRRRVPIRFAYVGADMSDILSVALAGRGRRDTPQTAIYTGKYSVWQGGAAVIQLPLTRCAAHSRGAARALPSPERPIT